MLRTAGTLVGVDLHPCCFETPQRYWGRMEEREFDVIYAIAVDPWG
jgi:hypothetical protein